MSRKWFDDSVPFIKNIPESSLADIANGTVQEYIKLFEENEINLVSDLVLNFAIKINLYLNETQPWSLIKKKESTNEVKIIIYNVLESTRIIGLLLFPLVPNLSIKINIQLGSLYKEEASWIEQLKWGLLPQGMKLPNPIPIIDKLEYE